jgi:hypothetical protein
MNGKRLRSVAPEGSWYVSEMKRERVKRNER